MRKVTPQHHSNAGHVLRLIAAASLACTLATFGCTTDRMPGAGAPQRYAPSVGPTMPSSTPGSEQANPINPPMTSSYTATPGARTLGRVDTDALAIAAAQQGFRGRYLGPANPGGVPSYAAAPTVATGQFISPTYEANPELTVNSSISSAPIPVITNGGGAVIVGGGTVATTQATVPAGSVASALTSNVTTTPTTAATTLTPTTAAATAATTNVTTSSAAVPAAAVISNSSGLLTPTITSGATISPTVAANPAVGNLGTVSTATRTTTTARTSALTTAASAKSPLIIGRTANGTVTVTNIRTVGDRLVTTTQPVTTPSPNSLIMPRR